MNPESLQIAQRLEDAQLIDAVEYSPYKALLTEFRRLASFSPELLERVRLPALMALREAERVPETLVVQLTQEPSAPSDVAIILRGRKPGLPDVTCDGAVVRPRWSPGAISFCSPALAAALQPTLDSFTRITGEFAIVVPALETRDILALIKKLFAHRTEAEIHEIVNAVIAGTESDALLYSWWTRYGTSTTEQPSTLAMRVANQLSRLTGISVLATAMMPSAKPTYDAMVSRASSMFTTSAKAVAA